MSMYVFSMNCVIGIIYAFYNKESLTTALFSNKDFKYWIEIPVTQNRSFALNKMFHLVIKGDYAPHHQP